MNRRVTIETPLGDQLKFRQLQGTEEISQLFTLDVDLLSESKSIDPKALLGKNATVVVETEGGGKRYIDGIVTRFGMQGQDHRMFSYRARLSPWLWLATRKSDFKIFQNKTVPEIIEEVLAKYGHPLDKKLNRSYRTWDYCVQYNETDCQFVSRLMEHEGIYYYHQHSAGQHVLTLADDIVASHSPLPGAASIPFYPPEKAAISDRECVSAWELAEEIKSGRHYNDDYDFKKPKADLSNMRKDPPGHAHDSHEIYEWPGGYTEYGDGEAYVRVRLQENLTKQSVVQGKSNCRALTPGYTFNLENYPRGDQNQQYLITSVQYHFQENPEVSSVAKPTPKTTKDEIGSIQRLVLKAQPTSLPFTPARVTPKPRSQGPQTAVVVGPPGEEIWTDKFGRVKVQFHWDRIGAMDENSSCWIRVSHPWAGARYGGIFTPRIGQEVIVDFLNGDPDYPIITGRVYNADQMPPWELPKHKTQSGFQTNWSKGGGGKHMLRFEDQKGIEHIELSTDHGNTHLHMGYLMNQGSEAKRSYGFELRTNEWGAIRADKGLLITTYTQDFKQKVAHDSPDGHEYMGATLAQSSALIQETQQAVDATKGTLAAVVQNKGGVMNALAQGLPSIAGAVQAVAAAISGGGGGPAEGGVSSNMDPAMPDAQTMLDLSKKIDKPIVSIVSPEGQTLISPKPVVISSGQSISIRSQTPMTLTSGGQFTQLVKAGMVTQVSTGGQVNTVSEGDVVSHARTGAMNLLAQQDASLTSTAANANVVGEKSALLQGKQKDAFVVGGERIALVCGKSSIVLLADGTVIIQGKKGFFKFEEEFDQKGSKIFLNC